MTSSNDRCAPIQDADWPTEIADMLDGFAGGLNVYRTMAHHPALLKAWADLREHVVNQTSLGAARSEVVILRTGHRLGSRYEWHQHIVRARAAGLSDARIASIAGPTHQMAADDALIATAVDELCDTHRLSDATQGALRAQFGTHAMFDLIATVGFYTTLGYLLNTCDTPLDDDIKAKLEQSDLSAFRSI